MGYGAVGHLHSRVNWNRPQPSSKCSRHGLAGRNALPLMSGYIHEHTGTGASINRAERSSEVKCQPPLSCANSGSDGAMASPRIRQRSSANTEVRGRGEHDKRKTISSDWAILAPALTVGYFLVDVKTRSS